MAKSFAEIKKSLGLLDFIQFGKYRGCRVDSIVDMDDDYLRYMQKQGIKFDAEVTALLTKKFLAQSQEVWYDAREVQEVDERSYGSIYFGDVPW
jgi:uncharacterized protein (DUF3820 family)